MSIEIHEFNGHKFTEMLMLYCITYKCNTCNFTFIKEYDTVNRKFYCIIDGISSINFNIPTCDEEIIKNIIK